MSTNRLALGTVQFGLDYGINNKTGKIPSDEVFSILDYCYKNGINYLDTAQGYGNSEEIIGDYIRSTNTTFKIISKLSPANINNISDSFYDTLKKIHLNVIYGFLFHDFDSFRRKEENWNYFTGFKEQGMIQKIGFSLYSPEQLEYILSKKIEFDLIQVPYNIFDRRFEKFFEELSNKNIEIHIRSIFLQGLFFIHPQNLPERFFPVKKKIAFLHELSNHYNLSLSSICINFGLLNKFIEKIVIGVDNLNNLNENLISLKEEMKVKQFYKELLELKEDDEKIILPIKWN